GVDVGVQDVFKHRTIAALAEAVSGQSAQAEERFAAPFELISDADRAALPTGLADAYPLSRVQLGMVVEMLSDPSVNRYHNCTSFRVHDDEPFAADAMREAVRILVDRHEVLRTAIHLQGFSAPLQLVHERAEMALEVHDVRHLDEDGLGRTLREFTARERATPFDLVAAPLQRITVHVDSDRSWWLSVTVCHAITEGWSQRLLVSELLEHYRALRAGRRPDPAPLPRVRYADFIAAELAALESADTNRYWKSVVTSRPRFTLPDGWGGQAGPGYVLPVAFGDLREGLTRLAEAAGASLKSVLLGAHLAVLGRLAFEPAFYTGYVCSARPEAEGAERVPGMYLNTVPFPHDGRARTWRELVRGVFDTESELWAHRALPMPAIAAHAGPGRMLEVMFSYRDFDAAETDLADGTGVGEGAGEGANEFPLAVSTVPGHLALTADPAFLSRANGERLALMYRGVLEAMAADPDGDPAAEHPADGTNPTDDWNDTAVEW
ncbi:condensation domain-containing protein, partial [Saccharothrix coeruleofusca]